MSHITTFDSKIVIKNEDWLKNSLSAMAKEFSGLTFQKMDADTYMVRYKPIENYQTRGNMRMVKNHSKGVWELQYDFYMCENIANNVRDAFFKNYQIAGVNAWSKSKGYTTTATTKGNKTTVIATKWR